MKAIVQDGRVLVFDDGHGHWVTIKGNKVKLDEDGTVLEGPEGLKGKKVKTKPYKKVGQVLVFNSDEDWEKWSDEMAENGKDITRKLVYINNGWRTMADGQFECKNWKTAINQFEAFFSKVKDHDVDGWIEGMRESCEMGYFADQLTYKSYPHDTPEELAHAKEVIRKGGHYAWGVEQIDDNRWYIFLNCSGIYAGHEERD